MAVLTAARSAIARSGATRSGYPILQGLVLKKYALSGVARSKATRSNYHTSKVFIAINGVQYGTARLVDAQKVLDGSLTLTDILNETPTTGRCTTKGFVPTVGQDVIITLGSINNLTREFGGQILSLTQRYVGTPANYAHDLNLIDYTWGLSKRKVVKKYTTATVSTIAADLISTYASGYTVNVAADIGPTVIDEITFTEQDLRSCLSQLAKRAGGSWYCDYSKVVQVFLADPSATNPTILNAVHPTLTLFAVSRDLSQVITRVYVEGGGTNALSDLAVGDTIIPVQNASWYIAGGGVVVCGAQRITYTGRSLGGGGGLVGPGASPSAASVLTLASGAGIESGVHVYAVTFVTAAGESLPSPSATITVGAVAAPSTAPTAGTPTIGTGPNAGSHDYAVTFVTASGETTAGPSVTKATTLTAAPSAAPTAGTTTAGAGVDDGNHDYAVTFVTSIGETTASPISAQVTAGQRLAAISAPSVAPTVGAAFGSGSLTAGTYQYGYTFVTATGETTPSPTGSGTSAGSDQLPLSVIAVGPSGTTARNLYRTVAGGSQLKFLVTIANNTATTTNDSVADASLGANAPTSNTATANTAFNVVPLSAIPTSAETINGRNLYRRSGGAGLKLLAYIGNNTTTTYTDTTANASLGAAVPATSTAYLQRIPLTAIPTGGALVTQRKVYRTAAGGTQLKLLATLADNTTTTFTDTVTDASLGANVPVANTATANQVAVSGIPIGAATVTSRKVYRTAAGASQLKLLSTIADNTTTTATDAAADATLGANVPVTDASGLTQPSGNVLAGSTTLIVAGTGGFSSTGGWAVIGNGAQVIRYTGVSVSSLTGIPATGTGAITATVGYNSTVTAAPQLTGVPASGAGSIQYAIKSGDPVNLLMQVDDAAAQTALAALIGGDGIQEDYLQDRRLSATEATARGTAQLTLRKSVQVTIRYQTRDINTRAGRTVTVNLGAPFSITSTAFVIQQVTVSAFQLALNPTYDVTATSILFTFDDLLRLARGGV